VLRTHTAGSLRAEHIGTTVTLTGWVDRRRDHGGVAFVDLRDASGIAQVVIRDEAVAHGLRSEYVLQVTGEVGRRPEGNENDHLATGEVEVVAQQVVVLNESAPLPFPVSSSLDEPVGEEARLRHRYLDLRRPAPAHAKRLPARRRAACWRRTSSSRSRPRRSRTPPPRARATSWSRPGWRPAPGTPCRSRRSCSSSC
jgi:aspartyl-tRNA synthetase